MIPRRRDREEERTERLWAFVEAVAALRDEDIEGVGRDRDEHAGIQDKF